MMPQGIMPPGMQQPGMATPYMPPMMPGMVSPDMMGPGGPGVAPPFMTPSLPYPMPNSGCKCGDSPEVYYPYGAPSYGMNPALISPLATSPFEALNMQGPYDKRFFTQTHYPTPYHEQLYMNEVAQGNDCRQEYMPPGSPSAVSPFMTAPMSPMPHPHHHEHMHPMYMYPPMGGYGPLMRENDESCEESSSSCSSS